MYGRQHSQGYCSSSMGREYLSSYMQPNFVSWCALDSNCPLDFVHTLPTLNKSLSSDHFSALGINHSLWGDWNYWTLPYLRRLVAGYSDRGPGFIPGQPMCYLWWIKWQWDRFFSEYLDFYHTNYHCHRWYSFINQRCYTVYGNLQLKCLYSVSNQMEHFQRV
jgi:hypothetical protein